MISFRQADLIPALQESQTPAIPVDFVITFPTANNGNEWAKKNDLYYAAPHIEIKNPIDIKINDAIVNKVESVVPGQFDMEGDWYVYANPGEYFDDFSKRLLREYKERLAPISTTQPTHSMQTAGRYQWIIHLNIKPINK